MVLTTAGLALGACGGGDGGIAVDDPWIRPTPPGAESTAFYATITNDSEVDDRLVAVGSPLCSMAEVHLTSMDDGVMSMAPAGTDELAVAKDESLRLEPGGLHVMCMGLTDSVVEGDGVMLTLEFETSDPVEIEAVARP
ncbi:MAG: copper chaperone PCu(A)C [Acidimicrobiales bacterium]